MNTCMFSNQDAVDCKMIKFTFFFFYCRGIQKLHTCTCISYVSKTSDDVILEWDKHNIVNKSSYPKQIECEYGPLF